MRLTRVQRMRVIVLLIAFEAGMPLAGMALGAPLTHLVSRPAHLVIDPYQLGSKAEADQLGLAYRTHLADTVDLTFVGRYIVPVVVGALGLLMLDECLNDDDDDDDEVGKARALVGARGLSVIGLGLGISLDELVAGFTLSFSRLPVAASRAALPSTAIGGQQVIGRARVRPARSQRPARRGHHRRSRGGNPGRLRHVWRYHGGITCRSPSRYANGRGVRGSPSRHDLDLSSTALMTCGVRTWQGISGVCMDASAGKLNEPLHGRNLRNSLNSPGSTVYRNRPGA
jgi:putative Mn2+ efflux pump MntP